MDCILGKVLSTIDYHNRLFIRCTQRKLIVWLMLISLLLLLLRLRYKSVNQVRAEITEDACAFHFCSQIYYS